MHKGTSTVLSVAVLIAAAAISYELIERFGPEKYAELGFAWLGAFPPVQRWFEKLPEKRRGRSESRQTSLVPFEQFFVRWYVLAVGAALTLAVFTRLSVEIGEKLASTQAGDVSGPIDDAEQGAATTVILLLYPLAYTSWAGGSEGEQTDLRSWQPLPHRLFHGSCWLC
jgi:hypothetical protein